MTFSADIDLGNVLTIVSMLGALWKLHSINSKRVHAIEFKVGMMWKHFAKKFDLPEELGKDTERS